MEIVKTFQKSRDKIFCNIILDKFVIGPFKGVNPNLKRIIACVTLFLFCFSLIRLALFIARQPSKASLAIALITASISSLSFYLISWNYSYIVNQVSEALSATQLGEDLDGNLSAWVKAAVNPWSQFVGSLVSVIAVTVILFFIVDRTKLSSAHFAKFFALLLVVFSMGQGAYWAIVSPLFTKELSNGSLSDLDVDPLFPTRTPILIAASKFLSVAAMTDAFMVTLCLVSLFIVRPSFSKGSNIYPFIIVLVGYLLTTWNFLYPQFNLARIIQQAKKNTLNKIRSEANNLYSRFEKLSSSEFERLEQIMKLYDTISKGPDTMINLLAFRSFIGSILAPTIAGILGVIDWKSLLQRFSLL
jgi:hypothetical protein